MSQHYSDPTRESDLHSLPNVEIWAENVTIVRSRCGEFEVPAKSEWARGFCPSCDRATCVNDLNDQNKDTGLEQTTKIAWWWWSCVPGYLPESEPKGPFATEAKALTDAQNMEG